MPDYGLAPLPQVLPFWPSDVFGDAPVLEEVALQDYDLRYQEDPERIEVSGALIWFQELIVDLAVIPGFSIAFLHSGDATVVDFEMEALPEVGLRLPELDVDLRLKNELLRPVERNNGTWTPELDANGAPLPLTLSMTGIGLAVDLDGNVEITGAPTLDLDPVAIADTGVVLKLTGIQPVLSRKQTPPQGAPDGFRGLAVDDVVLHLPEEFDVEVAPDRIEGQDLLIGSDGFSGTIQGTWDAPTFDPQSGTFADGDGVGTLFGIPFALRKISLTFHQSTVAGSSIRGAMVLPFFDQPLNIEVGLAQKGLTVALAADQPEGATYDGGLVTFEKEDVLKATVETIAFEAGDGPFAITLAGTLTPLVADVDWPGVEVKTLTIDAEGNVDIEGGWIDLPDQYRLDFHGFQLDLTSLGLGRNDDGSRWLGLNGTLQLVEGLPAGASTDGLRITWDESGLQGVSFDGIGIEFEVEGVLRFDGDVAYVQDGDEHRFEGAIDLDLISLGMQIDAQLVVGRKSGYTYFAIYVGADLPAGIPLFTTGLALYGMAGLYTQHMEPGKTDAQQWYSIDRSKSWYHSGEEAGVAVLSKWEARRGSMAFGAGVTIGTASDNGYAFNGKLLLAILLPGPVILLEGRANLMKERAELDAGEPNFRTLAVLDNREGSFLFGLDAQYKFDEKKGRLIDIRAGAEAYYDFSDPTAWYCYLGKKEPREQRIAARMYDLFEATAYYMLDAERLQVGARVGYDLRKSAGPLRVELSAWLEAGAALNWMPPHFFGELRLHGGVRLSAFGVGFGLTVDARIAADIFDPFHLIGTFSVALETPPLLPDPSADVTLEWGPIPDPPPLPLPLKGVAVEHFKTSAKWPLPRANGTAPALLRPNYDAAGTGYRTDSEGPDDLPPPDAIPVVPVDGRPHLTFAQPVRDEAQVGVNPARVDWVRIGDPEKDEGPAKARFHLDELILEKRSGGDWVPVAKAPTDNATPPLFGSWAPMPPLPLESEATDGTDHTPVKLWLWAKNPFAYALHAGREWEDWFLGEHASFPCIDVPEQQTDTYDFEEAPLETRLDVKHEGSERFWESPDGVTFRWDEHVFEVVRDGTIRLSRNERRVFSRTVWRGREGVSHAELERAVLRVGPSPKRYAVAGVVSDFFLDLARPYNRLLMEEQETRSDYAFYVDPQLETFHPTAPPNTGLRSCLSELGLSKALAFEFLTRDPLVLTMALPRAYARVALDLCVDFPTDLVLLGFDRDEQLQGWTQESLSQQGRVTLSVEGEDLRTLRLHYPNRGKTLHVLQITGETVPQEEIDERQRMAGHLQEETRRWEQTGNVLDPNQTYRLRIKTRVEARGEKELAGYEETLEQTEFAYFRTGGPPALPAAEGDGASSSSLSVPLGHPNPAQFSSGLDDLGAYVDQTVPPTVTGEGQAQQQPTPPVYRAYDVGLQFNEDYVELMYRQARRDLGLYLFDNNDRPVRDNRGRILPGNNHWGNTDALGLSDRDARWIETLKERNCVSVSETRIPHPSALTARAHGQLLRPDAAHEARLVPMLLHESFDGIVFHGWEVIHGQRGDWTLDRSTNLQGTISHVDGPVVHLDGSPDLSSVTPGLHLFSFAPPSTGLRPAYQILAVNPNAGTVTLDGRPDIIENRDYDYEITQPGPVRHTARTTGAGADPLRPGALVARGESTWSDYRLSVYARTKASDSTPTGSIGVVFRQQDGRYYRYALHAQPAVRRLTRVDGSTATVLDEEDFAYDANRDYQLTVEVVGEQIRVYQDGALVFDVTDAEHAAGGVGLYAWDNDGAAFRDVRVDSLRASTSAAYRFSFVTSRYAHFHHHLHSYQDETWPATLDPDAVSEGGLAALAAPAVPQAQVYDAPTAAEASAYDQLAQHALGTRTHAFPEAVEVTRVQHDGTPVAWLVRSPEPINWTRTALHVRRETGNRKRAASLPSRVKVTGASFGQGADEGLALLVREQASLDGMRVEYRHHTPGAVPTDLPGSDDVFGGLLLDARFEAPLGDDWTVVDQAPHSKRSSDWQVRDGELQQTENYYGFVGGMVNAPGTYVARSASDWSDYRVMVRLRSGDDDAIGVLIRYVDQDNYYRFSMDRQRGYRRLIKKEDGAVAVLWEDDKRYRRGHAYDLRVDCRGERLKSSLDGDPLFDVTDAAHPVGGVGLYCRANRAARFEHLRVLAPLQEWAPYHVFGDATTWGDGTVVRLHSAEGYAPTENAEHYVANAAAQQGTTFSPYGTEVRLVAPDGTTLHRRHVFAGSTTAFAATDLRLLRRADGTAFALVRPTRQGAAEPLQPGLHRLSFTFRRDNRRYDAESVVLRQNGASAPEHATLEVPWETLDVS